MLGMSRNSLAVGAADIDSDPSAPRALAAEIETECGAC